MSFRQKIPYESDLFGKFSDNRKKTGRGGRVLLSLCVLCVLSLALFAGCSRQHYRQKADKEVYSLLHAGGTQDPRWKMDDYRINVDCRSRMHDPYDPDKEPMPPDDLAAHRKMLRVDGKKGSKHWNDNGSTNYAESPCWRQYLLLNENGEVALDKDVSVDLALLHSPEYQAAQENLYLSAMKVSQERFRFDVQFYGGESLLYTANGRIRDGGTTSLVNDVSLGAEKLTASGGELVVGLANSITWTFNGQNTWQGDSLLNVGLMQPLLRGAGRKIILEDLTQSERDFLAAIRRMVFFQQGFYTSIVTGQGRQSGPSGSIGSGNTPSAADGFYGLLARQIQIQNLRQNIIGLEENLQRFQAIHEADQIDIFSVEETRQGLLSSESQLLGEVSRYESSIDTYLRSLGLPPDLKVDINDPLMEQFQLTSISLLDLQEDINDLLTEIRKKDEPLPDDFHARLNDFMRRTRSEIAILDNNVQVLEKSVPERIKGLRSLEMQFAEQIKRGDRIDPSVYSEEIFLKRIADLREKEIPENLQKLDAVFLLVDLIAETDAETLTRMIGQDDFPPEIQEALIILKLDRAAILEKNENLGRIRGELDQSEQTLEDLRELARREAEAAAEMLQKAETEGLELKYLTDVDDDKTIRQFMERKSNRREQTPTPAQIVIGELSDVDIYREWIRSILDEYQYEVATLSMMQTKARLDAITLVPTEINAEEAFRIAEENRLDWMNERAALVDTWRQIEIAANRLRGDLTLRVDGELGTVDKKGVRFDSDNGRVRIGFEWDSPMTRHTEMLNYRRSQIEYQAARRQYYTFVDSVNANLRQIVRDIQVNQVDFEIKRNAIFVAATQSDSAQLKLKEPPTRGSSIDTDTSRRLVSALQNMLSTQNQFLNTWVNYQTVRMQLDLNMGTMQLDANGRWIDPGIISKDRQGPSSGRPTSPTLTPRRSKHAGHGSVSARGNGGRPIPPPPRLTGEPALAPTLELPIETLVEPLPDIEPDFDENLPPKPLESPMEKGPEARRVAPLPVVASEQPAKSAFDLDTVPTPSRGLSLKDAPPPPKAKE